MPGFYDVGPLSQVAINLFYGWGYNFYRKENQLRADDQLIRSKAGMLLGWARKSVETAEREYRREFLPPPSREKPRPDANAIAGAQAIEKLSRAIGALNGLLTAQPVPENDRMTQRYREEAKTLENMIAADQKLIGQADLLRGMLEQKNGTWIVENMSVLEEGTAAIGETLRARQLLLFPTV
ncbi:MAG TPA: hypothetical protein VL981_02965 [Candidatus Methylacidiphilales bacterium]|nr:hypothetical protein [Candidatus Methylacidiphilales bacterium]